MNYSNVLSKLISANKIIIFFNMYFIFNSNMAYNYCNAPLSKDNEIYLFTMDFVSKYNPPFYDRPEWMIMLNCIDGYIFSISYIFTIYVALFDKWPQYKKLISLYIGAYLYSHLYYYAMFFNYPLQPLTKIPFYMVEAPYPMIISLITYKICKTQKDNNISDLDRKMH